jgi:dihydrolipoamide dehydrogenase
VIAVLDAAEAVTAAKPATPAQAAAPSPAPAEPAQPPARPAAKAEGELRQALVSTLASLDADLHAEVLVLGSGPGGYTAAFRAADLGKKVVLVERYATLGGVCLNVGCIPSKALLHAAKVIADAEDGPHFGVTFGAPKVELDGLRKFKEGVVGKLTKGLAGLAKARKVTVVEGKGEFASPHTLEVQTKEGRKVVSFDHCIIAAGSQSAQIPGLPYDDPRIMDSTGALELQDVPKRLLIIGGGIIGLEMATVYDALGSKVTVVEFMDRLIPGADPDIVKPLAKRIEKRYEKILLKTKVARIESTSVGLKAHFEAADGGAGPAPEVYDRVLLSVGRRPNGKNIGAEKAGVAVNDRGWIPVDRQMRTNVAHIFAIGDIVGEPMLAHKATHEGKLAAEVISGMAHHQWEARTIPSVAYTDPEVAWMGLSEPEAKAQGVEYDKTVFPWAASGRALGMGREEGLTKVLYEKGTKRILGAGIVGVNAGELIAETVLALEMGADAEDIGLTIHAHPTLSETVYFTAEMAEGTITDMMPPKK